MPKFTIEQTHSLDADAVRARLETLNQRLAEKYGLASTWKSPTEATIKGTGASGRILCRAGVVLLEVDLSFMLTPMRERIENRVRRELASALAPVADEAPKPA